MNILHIDSSIRGRESASRTLTAAVVEALRCSNDNCSVVYRDLALTPPGHFDAIPSSVQVTPPRSAAEAEIQHLDEFLSTDLLVIGAPMYNFTVPTQLKAWIDRILVPGKTFRYTQSGSEGLASGKTAIIVSTRGGIYGAGSALENLDHQERLLLTVLQFVGITDIAVIRAEGLAISEESARLAMEHAHSLIAMLRE